MANCLEHVVEQGTGRILYVCALTEGHKSVFPHHYDSVSDQEWWYVKGQLQTMVRRPMPLYETRTASRAAIASASAHTGQFGVIRD